MLLLTVDWGTATALLYSFENSRKSDTPRRAGGLMSGAASKAVAQLVLASR